MYNLSMKFVYIDESLKKEWEHLVVQTNISGFMQTFFWADFKRLTGWQTFKIGLLDKGKFLGGAIIYKFNFQTSSMIYIPEGPTFDYDHPKTAKYFQFLIKEIKKIAFLEPIASHLRIEPRLTKLPNFFQSFRKAFHDMEPKQTLMIDLTQSEDQIIASMKPKGRYNIKVAQKNGITVECGLSDLLLKQFLLLYHQTKTRNSFKGKEDWFFATLLNLLKKEQAGKFYLASLNGKPLAAALVLFFGKRATYFFGGSANCNKEKMAPYLLHWEIIKEAKIKECKWYDLWGISPQEETTDSWSGFTQFKLQFGGIRFDFIGSYDLIYDQKLYQNFLLQSGEAALR